MKLWLLCSECGTQYLKFSSMATSATTFSVVRCLATEVCHVEFADGRLGCAGIELAASCRAQKGERGGALMLLMAAAIIGTKNTAVGFLTG